MRKILFPIFGILIILFGCKKSDNKDTSASIVGTWNINKVVQLEYVNGMKEDGDTSTTGTINFASNGTYSEIDNTSTDNGTYSYNTSSKKLIVTVAGEAPETFNVTSLTSSNLHFTFDSTVVDAGITYRTTLDADLNR